MLAVLQGLKAEVASALTNNSVAEAAQLSSEIHTRNITREPSQRSALSVILVQ